MINVFQPCVGQEELQLIAEVLQTNWLGHGSVVQEFEAAFASQLKTDPGQFVSTTSGTEAIFLAAELFDFKSDDEIIVPSISFIAVGSSVVAKHAKLVLCDVDPHSLNVTADYIAPYITEKTKAVIVTHYGGVPCDMDPILDLCLAHNIRVIEDSACAVKSFYKGKATGTLGDMGLWSFEAGKLITTGDGGMVYLNSEELITNAKEQLYLGLTGSEKSGIDRSATGHEQWWEIQIGRPGRRAIMNNIAGAIGLAQLNKIDTFLVRRKAIYQRYSKELAQYSWLTSPPLHGDGIEPSYYFYWIQLKRRDELAQFLREHGVYSTFRYWPLHKVPYFEQSATKLPNSEFASQQTLLLPLHQALSDDDVTRVLELMKTFGGRL